MIALALHSGITPEVWAGMGEQAITTAYDVLAEQEKASRRSGGQRTVVDGG